jgi:hypothetical protein
MSQAFAALALAFVLVGCAGSPPPERSYYLLRAEVDGPLAPADPKAQIGLGRVAVAPYLDRAGVVVQISPHQVREARFHLWAEPLNRSIRFYLSDRLSGLLGRNLNAGHGSQPSWRYRIDVDIEELHGTLEGEARLVARWSLRDLQRGITPVTQRLARSRQQTGDGYADLVRTLTALLDELADEMAAHLSDLGR